MDRMTLARALAAAIAAVLVAACQAGGSAHPTASASPASPALAAADAKLFTGDYEGAEQDYQALAKAGTPGAASHYATLLDYESRFREAIAQASAAVDQHSDSSSLARLIRAYDWADDVNSAVATGQKAVAASPVDPLARIYFSEALADAGRFAEASAQLHTAERMGPTDPYVRSEIYREWANYYRDQGNEQPELNNIQLSLKEQPRFPERSLELARHQYAAKRTDAARAALAQATKGSRSAAVLQSAGDSALMAGDADTATAQYQAAAQAAPTAPGPVLAQAVMAVAVKRDFKGAHDSLLAALKASPARADIYEFLWHLDTYVLKTDPAELGSPPGDLDAARKAAFDSLNADRRAAGLGPMPEDPALDRASEAHAWYTVFNFGQPSLSGLGIHKEDPSQPAFVADSPIARDVAAGFRGNRGSEVINHVFTPQAAVAVWVDSVYHRFPLLDSEATAAGYGEAQVGTLVVSVMDVGLSAPARSAPLVYPADRQKDVPAAFVGNEVPDPAPEGTRYPVGYPITLVTGSGSNLSVSSVKLTGPSGPVEAFLLEPGQQVDTGEMSILPKQPLKPGATYTVEVAGTLDGQPLSKQWSFTVVPPAPA